MWLGTTTAGLDTIPSRLSSMQPTTISSVLPAPTWWNSPTAGSLSIRATAARWCGCGESVCAIPGSVSRSPSAV